MQSLINKQILLGVTGGIAAYKSAEIIRRLQDAGANVKVVMTAGAQEFITPLTLQALSGNPVHTELLDPKAEAAMGHIELSRWGDLILIAPATADFLSKLVTGEGSDLLSTLCLASRAPLAVAPAMNQGMWANAATQANLEALAERNVAIFGPASGTQACGDVGLGRMLEASDIVEHCAGVFESGVLAGKKVVISAGPTREAIDPVRYISNHSSGKMGYAIAKGAKALGATVTLVSGPVSLTCPDGVLKKDVSSAQEMLECVESHVASADIFIACAAVADYRVAQQNEHKLKKKEGEEAFSLHFVQNPDILKTVASRKNPPFTLGFAAETQNVEAHARAKLTKKQLNMIAANDVSVPGLGFDSDRNALMVITKTNVHKLTPDSKEALAMSLLHLMHDEYKQTLDVE